MLLVSLDAASPSFDLSAFTEGDGVSATSTSDSATITWPGRDEVQWTAAFTIDKGRPCIRELAFVNDGDSQVIANDLYPELRIVSGVRRITQQQTEPLKQLGIELTPEVIERHKWDAFWDAPLSVGPVNPANRKSSIPAAEASPHHPGMPRKASEIVRAPTIWTCDRASVERHGNRISIAFEEFEAGLFRGRLRFDLYVGSNLIRQTAVVKTDQDSVAFKYEAGLAGLPVAEESRIVYRDLSRRWQDYRFGTPRHASNIIVRSANRLIGCDLGQAGIAAFPPPHSFYWARETARNLGYGYYRKDDDRTFAFGIRQAEAELDPAFRQNFALYNARPGTWQRLPVFYLLDPQGGRQAIDAALAYTRGDRFAEIPGYKVMGHHYHVGIVERLHRQGNLDQRINDIEAVKAAGIDIYSIVDGVRGPARHDRGDAFVAALHEYYQAARMQSDRDFLVMPNDENSTGGRPPFLGGHYDLLLSHPIYWRPRRDKGEPLFESHPRFGRVYHIGSPADLLQMCHEEDVVISMPHPNTKRSTGYPQAILNTRHFLDSHYFSLGYRWGMGIDASERRLGEYRFLTLWNHTNNWLASQKRQPKFALAISETRSDHTLRGKPPWDDVYGMSPVNYVRLDHVPNIDDMSSIIDSLRQGDYFVTTGEVLIPDWSVRKHGNELQIKANVQWTFPLEFVELVWGDGQETHRQIVAAFDRQEFSSHEFTFRLPAANVQWLRIAAWDCATNGAMTQPPAVSTIPSIQSTD